MPHPFDTAFLDFLLRAKRCTYAASEPAGAERPPSRLASRDLGYNEGPYSYLDTYLGGFAFVGEEAVWYEGRPVWGMNYYGAMTGETIPAGFSGFLKAALSQVQACAPYRGPREWTDGPFAYFCRWEGDLTRFRGDEQIQQDGQVIYTVDFHGGAVI